MWNMCKSMPDECFGNRLQGLKMKDSNKITNWTMISHGTGKFLAEFLTGAYGLMVYYFFETELHLGGLYVSIATIIYSLWNAVNDPLIGFATGKDCKITRKYGRRSPWIIIGLLVCSIVYTIIFSVPSAVQNNQALLFVWMVIFVCIYDGCYSLWEVNYQGVFPDKFREPKTRQKAAIICTLIGVFGIALGSVLPPLFYTYGKPETFLKSALIVGAVGVIGSFVIRSGVKETPQMTERYNKKLEEEKNTESVSFFQSLRESVKHREFLALVLMLFLYQSACMCMTSSVNYVAHGVLGFEKGSATTPIFAGMLVGALVSVIVWKAVSKKIKNNNQKLLVITAFFMAVASFCMFFANSQLTYAIGMFTWGLGFGGFWTFMTPAMADVVDSVVVKQKRRDDGILMGVRAFFMRLSYASQAIVFWLCHKFTGYDSTLKGMQGPKAVIGIKLHISIIPAIFFLLAAVAMISLNTLTPEIVEKNREELKNMNL